MREWREINVWNFFLHGECRTLTLAHAFITTWEYYPTNILHAFNDWFTKSRDLIVLFKANSRTYKLYVWHLEIYGLLSHNPPFLFLSSGIIAPLVLHTTILDHLTLYFGMIIYIFFTISPWQTSTWPYTILASLHA